MRSENLTDETLWAKGSCYSSAYICERLWLTRRIIVQPSRDNRRPRDDYE